MALNLTDAEKKAIDEFKNRLLKKLSTKIKLLILFGSKARGDSNRFSDIDILVVLEKETLNYWDIILSISADVSLEYDLLLSVKIMDLSHFSFLKKVKSDFISNIEKDGASLWKAA